MILAEYKIKVIENLLIDADENINEQLTADTLGKGINKEIPIMILKGIIKKAKKIKKIIGGNHAKNGKKRRAIQKDSNKNKKNKC